MEAPNQLSRRRLLACGALGFLGGALSHVAKNGSAWGADPDPRQRGFKIGACDWTLGKRADPSSMALAKELGLDGVQVDFGKDDAELPLTSSELQQRFLSASKEHGVEIASLALGVLNDIPYKSDPRAEKWVLEAIGVCQVFGVKVALLAFFGNGDLRGDKEGTDEVVKRLKAAAPKAEEAGVVLGIESWLSAEEHLAILDRVGSPSVQVYYDVGNSHHIGHDIYAEIPQLGVERICEFHAKDYDDLYGKGSIDFPRVREAVDAIGYRGWIVIEGIELPLGLEESIRYDAEYLRKIFTNNG